MLLEADAVVYDRLVDPALLAITRPDARKLFVGKSPGQRGWTQARINQRLIDLAREGKKVVRLKGGDPFVFGRGAEEREALLAAGLEVEVVPGVSSATGVPAVAGLPLTHRTVASEFAVVTGHSAPDATTGGPNWEALAQVDTLVILMGMGTAASIQSELLKAGRKPETPALVICQGSLAAQKARRCQLQDLAVTIKEEGLENPGIIVIGEVVHHWRQPAPQQNDPTVTGGNGQKPEPETVTDREVDLYPITLTNLSSLQALVVGGGNVATRKARRLRQAGAAVTVVSPCVTEELADCARDGLITWRRRAYAAADLQGMSLSFATTDDPQVNQTVGLDSRHRGIPCNVASDRASGDFRVPATVMAHQCLIAVSSFTGDPVLAQRIRDHIGRLLSVEESGFSQSPAEA